MNNNQKIQEAVKYVHLFTYMYLAGLLLGLVIDAITYLFPIKLSHGNRISTNFIISILLFIVCLLVGGFTGIAIGFLSVGIYTTALLLALFGLKVSWKKSVYIVIILIVAVVYLIYLI
ncbi:hypothetical protein [Rummeliibacillus pycnus]|uniref:hypothetical protein n=1 Tax=Rummeliibacillus pycnus TaxID=101070 RepID=UPI001B8058B5|nr:hypothetical protein [Rummeliibacillus pycnus]